MSTVPRTAALAKAASPSPVLAWRRATTEPVWVRRLLITVALLFLALFLVLPLVVVVHGAFAEGLKVWLASITEPDAAAAIRLTLGVVLVVVPLNLVFGVMAAWAITKFEFRGKSLLITLIDMPFAISPVVVGLMFVILLGSHGWLGPWLSEQGIRLVFAVPGIILVITFGTLPFIARELIPLMQQQGKDEEEASLTLGANGWQTFWRVTLPNIQWGLIYGVILCNARAMGEFGAVAVISGRIRGETNTMPLHIEVLYNEYLFTSAFAVASLLAGLALVTIVVKSWVEWRAESSVRAANADTVSSGSSS